jgi:hypothetical protein
METESKTGPRTAEPASPLRRVGQVGLALINPFSDLGVIYRSALKPTVTKLQVLREQKRKRAVESLDWAQAVQRSGRTPEQLVRWFRGIRLFWWCVMTIAGSLSALLLLMLLAAHADVPAITLKRAITTDLLLFFAGTLATLKVMTANFRLWQLSTQRVSLDEGGSFKSYWQQEQVWLQVVTPLLPTQL